MLTAENFQTIEICEDMTALTAKNITNMCKILNKKTKEREFDSAMVPIATVSHCVKFDGQKLDFTALSKVDNELINELYFLLIDSDSSTSTEAENSED